MRSAHSNWNGTLTRATCEADLVGVGKVVELSRALRHLRRPYIAKIIASGKKTVKNPIIVKKTPFACNSRNAWLELVELADITLGWLSGERHKEFVSVSCEPQR